MFHDVVKDFLLASSLHCTDPGLARGCARKIQYFQAVPVLIQQIATDVSDQVKLAILIIWVKVLKVSKKFTIALKPFNMNNMAQHSGNEFTSLQVLCCKQTIA